MRFKKKSGLFGGMMKISLNWHKNDRHGLTYYFSGILVSVKTFTWNSKTAFILNRGQKSEILPSFSLATGKLKRCLLHYDVKDECTKIVSKNLLLPQYYCNIPCQCVKGSNVVERFYGHTTENTSRLGYKHVCVNYLHVASHDYQYQEVIQHTHWHTHIHTHPHSCLR